MFALSLGAQIYWGRVDIMHAYYGTDARLYQLLAGAMLSVAVRSWPVRLTRRGAGMVSGAGLVGLLVLGSGLLDISASLRGIGAMVVSVLLIAGLMLGESTVLSKALSRPVPVFLGRISYGTYLWHWPVILALQQFLTADAVFIACISGAVATGLAAISYELLEMPIRKSPVVDRLRFNPAVIGVATSAIVAVTLVPWVLHQDRRPAVASLSASTPVSFADDGKSHPVPAGVNWAAVSKNVGPTGTCGADNVAECTVVHGSGPHVLLIGDSQAQMLVPMFEKLATVHDFTLSLNVVAGCPWQEGLINLNQAPSGRAACAKARVGWYDNVLPKLHPDVVVLLDRPRDDAKEWASILKRRDGRTQPLPQATYETSRDTLGKITSVVPHTVLIQRIIVPETFQPDDCLASAQDTRQCAVPVPLAESVSDGFFQAFAAESGGKILPVDLNPAFCPGAPVCEPIVNGRVVWRDDHHLTTTYALARRDKVWDILSATGLFRKA
jgi:hypothetical protein